MRLSEPKHKVADQWTLAPLNQTDPGPPARRMLPPQFVTERLGRSPRFLVPAAITEVPMEHRGVEYAVVQTLFPTIWRWSVKRDHKEKVGTSFSREDAIRHAEKFIDQLIKDRTQPKE